MNESYCTLAVFGLGMLALILADQRRHRRLRRMAFAARVSAVRPTGCNVGGENHTGVADATGDAEDGSGVTRPSCTPFISTLRKPDEAAEDVRDAQHVGHCDGCHHIRVMPFGRWKCRECAGKGGVA